MRKQIIGILVSGLALTAMMWAQASPAAPAGRRGQVARGAGRMFQGLNLSDEQRSKVQALQQSQRSQMQALRDNTSLNEQQKRQQMQELRQNNHQQMLSILTPEQQAQMKQHRRQMGRRAAGRRGFGAGKMAGALNLSEQQKAQMKPVFDSTRQQMQALRSDTSLTPEQKREKMKEIRQNQMAQMKSILTPEQQQQMQQMRGRRHHRGEKQAPPSGF